MKITGRAVIEGIPFVGPSIGIIVDELKKKDVDMTIDLINSYENSQYKTKQDLENIIYTILSNSKTYLNLWNKNNKSLLEIEADRDMKIHEFQKILFFDHPIEKEFLKNNNKYLDSNIKKTIHCGNLNCISKDLIKEYMKDKNHDNNTHSIIRSYLMLSDYFHILDSYIHAKEAYEKAVFIAKNKKLSLELFLEDLQISYGHILLHLNQIEDAKKIFNESINRTNNSSIGKARDYFRIGEIYVFQGEYAKAIWNFNQSIKICKKIENNELMHSIFHILADDYRKLGTTYRMKNNLKKAKKYYDKSDDIYKKFGFRGRVWLLHGIAELYRAKNDIKESLKIYNQAKIESIKVCNINRVAHANLGICECKRLTGKIKINDYIIPYDIYKSINSKWGIANTIISQSLSYIKLGKENKTEELLNSAMKICEDLHFKSEYDLIQRIKEGSIEELHPLSLF